MTSDRVIKSIIHGAMFKRPRNALALSNRSLSNEFRYVKNKVLIFEFSAIIRRDFKEL